MYTEPGLDYSGPSSAAIAALAEDHDVTPISDSQLDLGWNDLNAETSLQLDLNGDMFIGQTVLMGQVTFGITSLGYAFRTNNVSSQVIPIRSGAGSYASISYPGVGWVGLGVAFQGSNFELYWENVNLNTYAKWIMESNGVRMAGVALSREQFLSIERAHNVDLNKDGRIG
jgi:hypothetical protein